MFVVGLCDSCTALCCVFFIISWALSRRLVAQDETSNRHQCWSDFLTQEGECQSSPTSPLSSHAKADHAKTDINALKLLSLQKVVHALFQPSDIYKTKRHTVEMKEHHSEEGTKCSNGNTFQDRRNQTSPLKLNPSFSLFSLVPFLCCRSPSTVRERLFCNETSSREVLWHCEDSERGEPSDFELSQHASPNFLAGKVTFLFS